MRLLPLARATALLVMSIVWGVFNRGVSAAETTDSVQPAAYATLTVRPDNKVQFDLAKLESRARIVSVSSGAIAFSVRLIDNDPKSVFRFSGTDLHPTLIVELANNEPLDRVSSLFEPEENVKLDVYLLNQLPKGIHNFEGAQFLNCIIDQGRPNQAAVDFQPTSARYVVFRWTREKATRSPFCVAEVSAFSRVSADQIAPIFVENEIRFTNESKIDFSNQLGVIADPPSVAVVSF